MYGLRGCAPCVSCMGLGLLKELKFLKVCLNENLPSFLQKKHNKIFSIDYYIDLKLLITISALIRNLEGLGLWVRFRLKFVYFAK